MHPIHSFHFVSNTFFLMLVEFWIIWKKKEGKKNKKQTADKVHSCEEANMFWRIFNNYISMEGVSAFVFEHCSPIFPSTAIIATVHYWDRLIAFESSFMREVLLIIMLHKKRRLSFRSFWWIAPASTMIYFSFLATICKQRENLISQKFSFASRSEKVFFDWKN